MIHITFYSNGLSQFVSNDGWEIPIEGDSVTCEYNEEEDIKTFQELLANNGYRFPKSDFCWQEIDAYEFENKRYLQTDFVPKNTKNYYAVEQFTATLKAAPGIFNSNLKDTITIPFSKYKVTLPKESPICENYLFTHWLYNKKEKYLPGQTIDIENWESIESIVLEANYINASPISIYKNGSFTTVPVYIWKNNTYHPVTLAWGQNLTKEGNDNE